MSILSNVIKVVGSIAENLEDIEAMKTFRMSNDNAARSESRTTVVTPMTCPKCGGAIQPPLGQNHCFCVYCGTPLHIDDGSQTLIYRKVDETRIREAEIDERLELARMELDEKRRPGRIKLTAFLAIIGAAMIIIGFFLGDASNDENSPWYMVAMLGMFPPMSIPFIWPGNNNKSR